MANTASVPNFNIQFFDEAKARRRKRDGRRRVVAYARLSFDEDGSGYCSIVNQIDILRKYYKENLDDGKSELEVIYDDNVSGYKFEREGLFKVFNLIEDGKCDMIIAKDLSRIGRHSALTQLFIEACGRADVRIVAMEDFDSHKESDDIILGIKAWSNERVVKDTSAKILKIIRHKQREGTWFCAAPFGYIVQDYASGKVAIDEPAAEIVRYIFNLYLDGYGVGKISKRLYEEKVMTPNMRARELALAAGKPFKKKVSETWSIGQLSKLLCDPFYKGTLVTGKYKRAGINGVDVRTNAEQQHVFENHHEAIIPKEVFDRAQEVKKTRVSESFRPGKNGETLFHGVVFCGECGSRLYTFARPDLMRQYVCSKYFRHMGCSRHMIREETLINITLFIFTKIKEQFPDIINSLDSKLAEERKKIREKHGDSLTLVTELDQKKKELAVIESQRIRQIAAHPERETSINEMYDEMYANVQGEIDQLNERIDRLKAEEESLSTACSGADLSSAMAIIDSIIENRSITRRDVELLYEKIVVFEDGHVEVQLRPNIGGALEGEVALKAPRRSPKATPNNVEDDHTVNVLGEGDPSHKSFIHRLCSIDSAIRTLQSLSKTSH